MTPREHRPEVGCKNVRANGVNFAYLSEGDGPLVVALHGFPDTAHTWDDVRPAIAATGRRVVTPFLRGYAPSSAPATDDYGAETLGRDVIALIDALGADKAIVIGHDFGAMAAWAAAALAPDRVERLVAVAIPHPASLRPTPKKIWGVRHFLTLRLPGAVERFARDDFADVRMFYERWSPGYPWPDAEFEAVKNAFAAPGGANAALGYYRCLGATPPPFLRQKITVPTLTIGGTTDGVATEEDFERGRRWVTARCDVKMLPGGHFLHREHPEPFREALLEFLAS